MHPYLDPFHKAFTAAADPENAGPMAKYMKGQFEYLGIKPPERRAISKEIYKRVGLPDDAILPEVLEDLWGLAQREFQYLGLDMLRRCEKRLTPEHLPLLERFITTRSWWDTVDGLAAWSVGSIFKRYPEKREPFLSDWRGSGNMWLRRTAILFQLQYKESTDHNLLFQIIRENLGSKEFFINKAIGWALREYSKRNAEAVKAFVAVTDLAPLSRREGLKWLHRKAEQAGG